MRKIVPLQPFERPVVTLAVFATRGSTPEYNLLARCIELFHVLQDQNVFLV
jgi:hypothetical protein